VNDECDKTFCSFDMFPYSIPLHFLECLPTFYWPLIQIDNKSNEKLLSFYVVCHLFGFFTYVFRLLVYVFCICLFVCFSVFATLKDFSIIMRELP